jgi:hypothetical protein
MKRVAHKNRFLATFIAINEFCSGAAGSKSIGWVCAADSSMFFFGLYCGQACLIAYHPESQSPTAEAHSNQTAYSGKGGRRGSRAVDRRDMSASGRMQGQSGARTIHPAKCELQQLSWSASSLFWDAG